MRDDFYPDGSVRELLKSDAVTNNTKQVLNERLLKLTVVTPQYLSEEQFETLKAVCARLIPQPPRDNPVDLPGLFEEQLYSGSGNGWRYAEMPDDNQVMVSGLHGIAEMAILSYNKMFHLLNEAEQDEILLSIQQGVAPTVTWERLSGPLFFEEMLSRLVEIYYSHPLAKEEIGDVSFADAKGWAYTSFNHPEPDEPRPVKTSKA